MSRYVAQLIARLQAGQSLESPEFAALISAPQSDDSIRAAARDATDLTHGRRILVRGLLEISNRCRNNCYYCGIRAANTAVERYSLTVDEIVESCRNAYSLCFRTFVLQGGEWPQSDSDVEEAVRQIHDSMPDCAITLSLGERSRDVYRRWREAGATRYLLRHETASPAHYSTLHPASMKLSERIGCLHILKELGYQTGAGMMIGSPGQSISTLCDDLMLLRSLQPEMIGIGPFIPHRATPLGNCEPGELALTLRIISIVRLMLPYANIPSTTALATLHPDGRNLGFMAGANVVMPNITPCRLRGNYQLYDNKASFGAESAEGLAELSQSVGAIGFTLDFSRGDFTQPDKTDIF